MALPSWLLGGEIVKSHRPESVAVRDLNGMWFARCLKESRGSSSGALQITCRSVFWLRRSLLGGTLVKMKTRKCDFDVLRAVPSKLMTSFIFLNSINFNWVESNWTKLDFWHLSFNWFSNFPKSSIVWAPLWGHRNHTLSNLTNNQFPTEINYSSDVPGL